jgi:hypothetical protein
MEGLTTLNCCSLLVLFACNPRFCARFGRSDQRVFLEAVKMFIVSVAKKSTIPLRVAVKTCFSLLYFCWVAHGLGFPAKCSVPLLLKPASTSKLARMMSSWPGCRNGCYFRLSTWNPSLLSMAGVPAPANGVAVLCYADM